MNTKTTQTEFGGLTLVGEIFLVHRSGTGSHIVMNVQVGGCLG